jgi:hypothetical protein
MLPAIAQRNALDGLRVEPVLVHQARMLRPGTGTTPGFSCPPESHDERNQSKHGQDSDAVFSSHGRSSGGERQ